MELSKQRKRAAVAGGLTGIVMALTLSITHHPLVTPAGSTGGGTTTRTGTHRAN